jgi:hypothetical protein
MKYFTVGSRPMAEVEEPIKRDQLRLFGSRETADSTSGKSDDLFSTNSSDGNGNMADKRISEERARF